MKDDDQIAAVAIPLTRGKYTYVSQEDADLKELSWHSTSHGRAARTRVEDHKMIYLHKVIAERMGIDGEVDHIDNDPLNNRRSNLRGCTRTQNQANAPKSRGETSWYKGVHWSSSHEAWVAQIKHNEKVQYLGQFDVEIDAALVYDAAAIKEFSEFAGLNFPILREIIEKATEELQNKATYWELRCRESRAAPSRAKATEGKHASGQGADTKRLEAMFNNSWRVRFHTLAGTELLDRDGNCILFLEEEWDARKAIDAALSQRPTKP